MRQKAQKADFLKRRWHVKIPKQKSQSQEDPSLHTAMILTIQMHFAINSHRNATNRHFSLQYFDIAIADSIGKKIIALIFCFWGTFKQLVYFHLNIVWLQTSKENIQLSFCNNLHWMLVCKIFKARYKK